LTQAEAPAGTIPTGNTFDKYGTRNPLFRRLVARFTAHAEVLLDLTEPKSVLDVGCGEGVLTERIATRLDRGRVVGIDLEDPALAAEWARRKRPNLEFHAMSAERLAFEDNEFDVATALEVLEHVDDPEAVLAEMSRVAQRYLLVSVPREPLWRALNMARGAYLRDRGNTPGHLHHWSKPGFVELLSGYGHVEKVRSLVPWTMALVRLA
jgi:2-polyprenyl-3-methyl-5-hydroxy-6-metoxy-1,4-benzoquinol methylase